MTIIEIDAELAWLKDKIKRHEERICELLRMRFDMCICGKGGK